MAFRDRTRQSDRFVSLMNQWFWTHPALRQVGVFTAPYGYPTVFRINRVHEYLMVFRKPHDALYPATTAKR